MKNYDIRCKINGEEITIHRLFYTENDLNELVTGLKEEDNAEILEIVGWEF